MAEKKKFLLRIDEALWDDLAAWAADELRSVNGQIEYILKHAAKARAGGKQSAPPSLPRKGDSES
jgi:hypothetical protein